ncbi:uncharacterized protein EAF01_003321 [Botrytis porri]|uniref:Uncharacterized protein n=1 Tax=Botrytis porri TaxID=87229 RepID=A0A4Z1KYF4_9HELO|nr:uncharacterized protein EAF01_003321 [Botrytis porri]KAF7909603.1 hypothetical protein EAF01_003321 [Botrytis porri]TGO89531.1 hypothetical protein BPOR_0105g00150 [Botrytis porri]
MGMNLLPKPRSNLLADSANLRNTRKNSRGIRYIILRYIVRGMEHCNASPVLTLRFQKRSFRAVVAVNRLTLKHDNAPYITNRRSWVYGTV